MTRGGHRSGSGRKPVDSVRIECRVLRPVYDALIQQEALSGVYRTRLAARILAEGVMNEAVRRELAQPEWRPGAP